MNEPVVKTLEDFVLEEHELISGEPVFYIPIDPTGNPTTADLSDQFFGFVFNVGNVDYVCDLPFFSEDWDRYAVCLYKGRLGRAPVAMGLTGEQLATLRGGWFTRYPQSDLHWEVTVKQC